MHINVRNILAEEVGYNRTFKITDERPPSELVQLTKDLEGEITISRLETGLLAKGTVSTEIQLECHRCLSAFTRPVTVNFSQVYREQPRPEEEEQPIIDEQIDLVPPIEQEIMVHLPIKLLCRPDCPGVEDATAEYTKDNMKGQHPVAVPKKRTTSSTQGQRRSHLALKTKQLITVNGLTIPRRLKKAAELGLLKITKKA